MLACLLQWQRVAEEPSIPAQLQAEAVTTARGFAVRPAPPSMTLVEALPTSRDHAHPSLSLLATSLALVQAQCCVVVAWLAMRVGVGCLAGGQAAPPASSEAAHAAPCDLAHAAAAAAGAVAAAFRAAGVPRRIAILVAQ